VFIRGFAFVVSAFPDFPNPMRIKIIGDNNCARATRHLLRLAGFAVTEFLPVDAVLSGPHFGCAITVDVAPTAADRRASHDLSPASPTPDLHLRTPDRTADFDATHRSKNEGGAFPRPDSPAVHHAPSHEEASRAHRDASLPASVGETASRTTTGGPTVPLAHFRNSGSIHFDSVESALEAAVLRHVTQLAAAPVIVDRPGGVVHSDRELRIVAPNTGDAKADEAAAVAIEFGVLRGLLDLTAPTTQKQAMGKGPAEAAASSTDKSAKKKWWLFGIALIATLCVASVSPAGRSSPDKKTTAGPSFFRAGGTPALQLTAAALHVQREPRRLKPVLLRPLLLAAEPPQGQFATGQGFKITDGNDFWVIDPCKGQAKSYASINQTANAQLAAGTAAKKIYVCSIHVVVAAATNIAVVEGTACGTGTSGVGGFGGATAATGWNFAANGGIALGNGDASLGAEVVTGDNLCIFNSGSGQVSGGISYVVQ
jgi:hypothetical protein